MKNRNSYDGLPQKGEYQEFVFSWSSKHTRLSFQLFIASLLAYGISQYGISNITFFGIVDLEKSPSKAEGFYLVFGFAVYSLIGFVVRTIYEMPDDATELRHIISRYKRAYRDYSTAHKKLKAFENGNSLKEWVWGKVIEDSNQDEMYVEISRGCEEIIQLINDWKRMSPENEVYTNPNFRFLNLQLRYSTIGVCAQSYTEEACEVIEKKIVLKMSKYEFMLRGVEGEGVTGKPNVPVDAYEVLNLNREDFKEPRKLARKQKNKALSLYVNAKLGSVLRFLDVYFLSFIAPLAASVVILYYAVSNQNIFPG